MSKYPRNVWITTIGSLLTDISSEMIVYLLPLFLAGVLGLSANEARAIAVGIADQFLRRAPIGRLVDLLHAINAEGVGRMQEYRQRARASVHHLRDAASHDDRGIAVGDFVHEPVLDVEDLAFVGRL